LKVWKSHITTSSAKIPALTDLSDAMSTDLKRRWFNFVGSIICYAFMQAVGMVNGHTADCFRYLEIRAMQGRSRPESKPTCIIFRGRCGILTTGPWLIYDLPYGLYAPLYNHYASHNCNNTQNE
jgi:hypothetical protein